MMNWKNKIAVICLLICILFTISCVSATDSNITDENSTFSQDIQIESEPLGATGSEDTLSSSEVYFDASASSDGDGSYNNPYKYLRPDRISYGSTAVFREGTYEINYPMIFSSSGNEYVSLIGSGSDKTIFVSNIENDFSFIVDTDSTLYLQDITLTNVHINNHADLYARDVVFRDSVSFDEYYRPSLDYSYQRQYNSQVGGTIICDTPEGVKTRVKLMDCVFVNNNAKSGGAIALHHSWAYLENCIFYNSSASQFGGAIYSRDSDLIIINSTFTKSNAKYGGTIYFKGSRNQLQIGNSSFDDSNSSSFGGAISIENATSLILNTTFTNYESEYDGGGAIYAMNTGLTVYLSSFYGGKSYYGGAICSLKTDLNLYSSKFRYNDVKYYGGSIYTSYGNIYICDSTFSETHAKSSGGAICSRLPNSLKLESNTFENTTSLFGHMIFVDGDNGTVTESNNINRDLYNLVCLYSAKLNGQQFYLASNYLTFSVSSDNLFIQPIIDETTHPVDSSNYASFKIWVDGEPSELVYANITELLQLKFNLTKYTDSFTDELIEAYIVNEAGEIVATGSTPLLDKNYYNEDLFEFSFREFIFSLQYGNLYDINSYSAVPLFNYTVIPATDLPSSYDSRDYGYITPAKDQKDGGNCWAFSGIATLEACIKKATGLTYDFSEENTKNLMAAYSIFGWDSESNNGGNLYMFIAYLASWFGPVYDTYDPYDDYSSLSVIYDSALHIQNVYCIPEREDANDNDLIKQAIMDYGAVSISVPNWEGDTGHAITLIGWDDSYTGYDYFKTTSTGAWIFKNSWGEDWQDNGCYYLSYQRPFISPYTFIFNEDKGYTDIYQYDFSGTNGYLISATDDFYYKNRFNATGDEIISAASTYFYNETDFELSIYVNGELKSNQSGHAKTGYYTFALENEVPVKQGDYFDVQFRILDAVGKHIPLSLLEVVNRRTYDAGMSFYGYKGHWFDCFNQNFVACIKAFTRQSQRTLINISTDEFSTVKANEMTSIVVDVPKSYQKDGFIHYIDGFVTFTVDDNYYYVFIEDGKAYLNITFTEIGNHTFTVQYVSNLEMSNQIKFNFEVVKYIEDHINLKAEDVSKYYGGSEKYVAVLSENGKPIAGEYVTIRSGNLFQDVKTDSQGRAIADLNLSVGTHTVTVSYGAKSYTSKLTVLTTLSVQDTVGSYSEVQASGNFLDSNGRPLSQRQVTFKIGSAEFNAITNYNGEAVADIGLDVGIYNVTAINMATGEQKQFKLEIMQQTTACSLAYTQNGDKFTFTATLTPNVDGNVSFIFDGTHSKVIKNGVATFEIDNLAEGEYNITAIYAGDKNHKSCHDTVHFTYVPSRYSLIFEDKLSLNYGSKNGLAVLIEHNLGEIPTGRIVKFSYGENEYNVPIDESGKAIFDVSRLNPGSYKIKIEFDNQSGYTELTINSTISEFSYNGEYLKSDVTARFIDSDGKPVVNKLATFNVNVKQFTGNANQAGYATAKITDLDVGTYVVNITNPATGEIRSFELEITKTSSEITLEKSININDLTLTAILNPASATGSVVFTVLGERHTMPIINGRAVFTLDNIDLGSYTVSATYAGDRNFNGASASPITFRIIQKNITIIGSDCEKYYGDSFTVKIIENRKPVADSTVYVNNEEYLTDSNGTVSLKLDQLGSYMLTYQYGEKTVSFNVNVKSTVELANTAGTYLNTKVSVRYVDEKGNLLKNQQVTLNVNQKEFAGKTDSNGVAEFDIVLTPSKYDMTAVNPVTNEDKVAQLTISKATPVLTLQMTTYDNKDAIIAKLSYTNVTGSIIFTCDGKDYPIYNIWDGTAYLTFSSEGTYYVHVKYSGDDNFNEASGYIQVIIPSKEPRVICSDLTKSYLDSSQFTLRLVDYTGKPIASGEISITVYDSAGIICNHLSQRTDANGFAIFSYNNVPDTYYFKIKHDGKYRGSANVIIKKAASVMKASKKTFKAKVKTKKYKVSLSSGGRYLSNCKVTIKVGGKTYSAKTNSKGVATLKIKKLKKKGSYTAIVKFGGNSYYNAVSKKVKIKVK